MADRFGASGQCAKRGRPGRDRPVAGRLRRADRDARYAVGQRRARLSGNGRHAEFCGSRRGLRGRRNPLCARRSPSPPHLRKQHLDHQSKPARKLGLWRFGRIARRAGGQRGWRAAAEPSRPQGLVVGRATDSRDDRSWRCDRRARSADSAVSRTEPVDRYRDPVLPSRSCWPRLPPALARSPEPQPEC